MHSPSFTHRTLSPSSQARHASLHKACELRSPAVQVGVDFAAPTPLLRLRSMKEFNYQPDPGVVALLERFLHTQWRGFGQLRDIQCRWAGGWGSDWCHAVCRLTLQAALLIMVAGDGFQLAAYVETRVPAVQLDPQERRSSDSR